MEEILFRGICKEKEHKGQWIYGDLRQHHGITAISPKSKYPNVILPLMAIKKKTLGIYTTFKDKNNKRIFTGDIVKSDDGGIETVTINNGCVYPVGAYLARSGFEYDKNYYEIIGNIYDNPSNISGVLWQQD